MTDTPKITNDVIVNLYQQAHNSVMTRVEEDPELINVQTAGMVALKLSMLVHDEYTLLYKRMGDAKLANTMFHYKDKIRLLGTYHYWTVIGVPPKVKSGPDKKPAYLITDGKEDLVIEQDDLESGLYELFTPPNRNLSLLHQMVQYNERE